MFVKITTNGAKEKPGKKEFEKITAELKKVSSKEVTERELGNLIRKGHSFILANYVEDKPGITKDLIKSIDYLALDVDGKENPIKMHKFIFMLLEGVKILPILAYRTFRDTDETRFRVIYKLNKSLSVDEYEKMYKGIISLYGKYLDNSTNNANRLWCGTNKKVVHFKSEPVISNDTIDYLISLAPKSVKKEVAHNKPVKGKHFDNEILNKIFIKGKYKNEITDNIYRNVSIYDFITRFLGGSYKRKGNKYFGCCPIHNGDNKEAFVIYADTNTYRCYTQCNSSGNVITLAKLIYKTDDFTSIVLQLLNDGYSIEVPKDAIGIKKGA